MIYFDNGKARVKFDIVGSGGNGNRRSINMSLDSYLAYTKATNTIEELRVALFNHIETKSKGAGS